ncbi:MAG: inner membrane-spanning protein YciB [Alphaproteobacteria bacterium]
MENKHTNDLAETPTLDAIDAPKPAPANLWLDLGPVAIFVIAYQYLQRTGHEGAIFTAAAIFTGVAVLALIYSRVKHGKFPNMLLLTTVIIIISVGLAFLFKDPIFIYMKPTVINALFGIAVLGGVFFKKNVIKLMMGAAMDMPDKAWNVMAIRWGVFFFVLAIINEVVWRNFPESFWINFKLFGFFPLTLIFAISQAPFMMRHGTMKEG